jgi:hypothetical protein
VLLTGRLLEKEMLDCGFEISDLRFGIARCGVLLVIVFGAAGCVHKDSRYEAVYAGQGGVAVKEQPNPPQPARAEAQPPGPTAREIELQRRVDELEAKAKAGQAQSTSPDDRQRKIEELEAKSRALQNQSKELQAEIERLKREK